MFLRRPKTRPIFLIYKRREDPRTYRQHLLASGHIDFTEQKEIFECKLGISFLRNISMYKNCCHFFVWGLAIGPPRLHVQTISIISPAVGEGCDLKIKML